LVSIVQASRIVSTPKPSLEVVNRAGRVMLMGRSLGRLKAAAAELGPLPRLPSRCITTTEDAVRRAFNGIERIKETA
jgi:hypothetical protein